MLRGLFLALVLASPGQAAINCQSAITRAAQWFGYHWASGSADFAALPPLQLTLPEPELRTQLFFAASRSSAQVATPTYAQWDLSQLPHPREAIANALQRAFAENAQPMTQPQFHWAFRPDDSFRTWMPLHAHDERPAVKLAYEDRFGTTLIKEVHGSYFLGDVPHTGLPANDARFDGRLLASYAVGTPERGSYVYVKDGQLRCVSQEGRSAEKRFQAMVKYLADPMARSYVATVGATAAGGNAFEIFPQLVAHFGRRHHAPKGPTLTLAKEAFRREELTAHYFAVRDFFQRYVADDSGLAQSVLAVVEHPNARFHLTSVNALAAVIDATSGRITHKQAMQHRLETTFSGATGELNYRTGSSVAVDRDFRLSLTSSPFRLRYRIDPDGTVSLKALSRPETYQVRVDPLDLNAVSDAQVKGLAGEATEALLRVFTPGRN